jgi:hypothetical protein
MLYSNKKLSPPGKHRSCHKITGLVIMSPEVDITSQKVTSLSQEVAICRRMMPYSLLLGVSVMSPDAGFLWSERAFVTGSVRKSLHSEYWHGHRKWPHVTGSGRMSPDVAYVTGSGRMSPEVAVCHRTWLMSPEVAVCHRKFAEVVYRTVNRMLTGLVGLKKNCMYTVV